MSRGGANPNWEYQLVDRAGHTSDLGLRHRAMLERGHRGPGKRQETKAKKRTARALNVPLEALFDVLLKEK